MRNGVAVMVLVSVMGCGAPEGSDPKPWTLRPTRDQPSALQRQIVGERIASTDPLDAAWGAYLAGELGIAAMADDLVGLTQDGPLLRAAALDALARVGGKIADARLRELMTEDHMTAMAVALQDPAAHRNLVFESFLTVNDALPDAVTHVLLGGVVSEWRAYANALTWLRDREFASVLLATLETSIQVRVVSPERVDITFGCGCGGRFATSCVGFSHLPFTALPPLGTWSIREADDEACLVVLPGPVDVCVARVEGRFDDDMRDRALAGLPLRQWVSSIGHDGALAVIDDYDTAAASAFEADALAEEALAEEALEPGTDDDDDEAPPVEARDACPATAERVDDELAVVASPLNDTLLTYISALADEQVSFDGRISVVHVWRGEAAYRAAIDGLRQRIRVAHAAVGRALADAYLLPDDYRLLSPAIQVVAYDERSCGATTALPRL